MLTMLSSEERVRTAGRGSTSESRSTDVDGTGDGEVVSGWKNKLQSAIANVTPGSVLAEQHRRISEPGSAKRAGR